MTAYDDELDVDIASDRAGIISMVALMDEILADKIRGRLIVLSKTIDNRLFSETGPLGNLSARIDFGYALGMYGPHTRTNLHNIRKIRNCFAHRHEASDFEHPRVKELCTNLTDYYQSEIVPPKSGRSLLHHILIHIMLRIDPAGFSSRPIAPANLP